MLSGIPLGRLAAQGIGWRGLFWLLAAMCLVVAAVLQFGMPPLRTQQRLLFSEQLQILRDPVFVANLALSVLMFTAMFTAYTYLADTLKSAAIWGSRRSSAFCWPPAWPRAWLRPQTPVSVLGRSSVGSPFRSGGRAA